MDNKQVSAALVKAQRSFGAALKTHTNPAFKAKYADLGACIEAVIDALNDNGIALVQKQHIWDGGVCIETVFIHESGEQLSSGYLRLPATKQDPQGYGSALTYARRYSLMAACGIAPEDDDGNAASKRKEPPSTDVPANVRADWLQSIAVAAIDELDEVKRQALAVAEKHQDRGAFAAFSAAAKKRREALAKVPA